MGQRRSRGPQQPPAKRAFYVQMAVEHDGGMVEFSEDAEAFMGRMLTTLAAVGGTLIMQAHRVKVGEIAPGEPIAITQGLFARWESTSGKLYELSPDVEPVAVPAAGPDPEDHDDAGDEPETES